MTKTSHFCLTESFLNSNIYTLYSALLALFWIFAVETLEDFEGASAATDSLGGVVASIVDDPETDGISAERLRILVVHQGVKLAG